MPARMSIVAWGLTKLAVPTWTADAPAIMNSSASRAVVIPPIPITGTSTSRQTCQTMRRATGLIAGPESPPVTLASTGRRFFTIDGHADQGVDQREGIGTFRLRPAGDGGDVGDVRRKL